MVCIAVGQASISSRYIKNLKKEIRRKNNVNGVSLNNVAELGHLQKLVLKLIDTCNHAFYTGINSFNF